MLNFAIYISDHGFGHATRACALIEELIKCGVYCHIRSSRPDFIFETLDSRYYHKSAGAVDFGVKHSQNLILDLDATKSALLLLFNQRIDIVSREIEFLRRESIDLVIADVPYLIAEAALYAKVPIFAISNFDWAFIYDGLFQSDESLQPVLNCLRQLYGHVQHAFRLPFSSRQSMAAFPQIEKVGLLARRKAHYNDLHEVYEIKDHKPILVCMFGGEGDLEFDIEKLCQAFDGTVFSIQSAVNSPNHISVAREADFLDLIYGADIILTKPGYSTFAEAVQFGKYIIFHERTNYPEETVLVAGLDSYPNKLKLERIAMSVAQWKAVFKKIKLPTAKAPNRYKNQNAKIAKLLLQRYLELGMDTRNLQCVLDIGSNNLIYMLWDHKDRTLFHKQHFTTGMAKGFNNGLICKESMDNSKRVIEAVLDFNQALGVPTSIIATSVSRRATNINDLATWVEHKYGIRYQIISEQKEIDYNFAAIQGTLSGYDNFIAFDIGGGSTEVILCKNRKQHSGASMPIGLMSLQNSFSSPEARLQKIAEELEMLQIYVPSGGSIIGVGLTFSIIVIILKKQIQYEPGLIHGATIHREQLERLKDTLASGDIAEIQNYMLDPNSADVLALSVDFIILILDKYQASEIIVCEYGISLGYIIWNEKRSKSRKSNSAAAVSMSSPGLVR